MDVRLLVALERATWSARAYAHAAAAMLYEQTGKVYEVIGGRGVYRLAVQM